MSSPPPQSPAECLAAILQCMAASVASRTGWALSLPLIKLIIDRIRGIKQTLARLTDRLSAGTYAPRRRSAAPRRPAAAATAKPRPPNALPRKPGWLVQMVPEAAGYRSQLEHLFRDPAMAALLAAAPVSLGRPLRALCHMLGATPPPIIAPPPRPRPPRKIRVPAPAPPPRQIEGPEWLRTMPRQKWTLYRMCGRRGRL